MNTPRLFKSWGRGLYKSGGSHWSTIKEGSPGSSQWGCSFKLVGEAKGATKLVSSHSQGRAAQTQTDTPTD